MRRLVLGRAVTEEDVRLTAVRAARYPAWPELRPRLQELAADDPDDGVRAALGAS